jgi:outer membrane murein-binding lipoprotein Lpp
LAAVVVGSVLLVGCGESRHANEQRPQVSTRVSVTINPKQLIVQPTKVAVAAEPNQEVEQNEGNPAPPIKTKAPLDLTIVAANQTATDTKLKISGAKSGESETIYAHSPGTFGFTLPAGNYTISAVNMPEARAAHLTVGSYRASSQNDLLLP